MIVFLDNVKEINGTTIKYFVSISRNLIIFFNSVSVENVTQFSVSFSVSTQLKKIPSIYSNLCQH